MRMSSAKVIASGKLVGGIKSVQGERIYVARDNNVAIYSPDGEFIANSDVAGTFVPVPSGLVVRKGGQLYYENF